MIETKTSAQVNEFAIVENIFGSHLKAVAKAEDKKHFAIMEGNEILTPFELESHGIAFNGVVLLKAGDKMGMLAFDLGNIYIAPEYDYINEAAVGDLSVAKINKQNSDMTRQRYKLNLRNSLLLEEYFQSWSNLTPHCHL